MCACVCVCVGSIVHQNSAHRTSKLVKFERFNRIERNFTMSGNVGHVLVGKYNL